MSITVVIDRDPVAAGDDVSAHGRELTLADDARVGDAVLRMIDDRYLFMKSVTWIVAVVRNAVIRRDDGVPYVYDGTDVPIVGLLSDDNDPPGWTVLPLSSSWHSRTRFAALRPQTETGEYVLRARYVSNGRLTGLDAYREQVAESDEAEAARWAAYAHRTWPQYFDEHGRRR